MLRLSKNLAVMLDDMQADMEAYYEKLKAMKPSYIAHVGIGREKEAEETIDHALNELSNVIQTLSNMRA